MDGHTARSALQVLLEVVRRDGVEWRELLEVWIEDAHRRGLLVLVDGLVHAELPDVPRLEDVPEDVEDRYGELRRLRQADHERVLADASRLTARVADHREVDALGVVLQGGHAQSLAMYALGAEMVDVPFFLSLAASDLATGSAPMAHASFRGVSRTVVERTRPVLEAHLARHHRADAWKLALQNAFFALPMVPAKSPREAVCAVLDLMAAACEPPAVFRHALPKHVAAAERVLRDLRKREGAGYRITLGPKPGRGNVTPWGAARKFARAFGVEIGKESEVKRNRTAERAERTSPPRDGRGSGRTAR